MCKNYKYMLQIKPEFDDKFKITGKHTQMIYLCEVKDVVKGLVKLNYDKKRFNLLVKECGKCSICRFKKASIKACQAQSEFKTVKKGAFITLTFGDKSIDDYLKTDKRFKDMSDYKKKKYRSFLQWTLEKREFQLFMKRLRWHFYQEDLKKYSLEKGYIDNVFKRNGTIRNKCIKCDYYDYSDFQPRKIRFLHCGEYGENKGRPHHHAIIFGVDFSFDKTVSRYSFKKNRNVLVHFNNLLSKLWQFGEITTDKVTYQSCNYVARYVTKKVVNRDKDESFIDLAGKVYNGRLPEYCTQSNRRGLGYEYYMKNAKKINKDLKLYFTNNKGQIKECSLPRYFKELMYRHYKSDYLRMQKKSAQQCQEFSNTSPDLLFNRMISDSNICNKLDSFKYGDFDSTKMSINNLNFLNMLSKQTIFDNLKDYKSIYLAKYDDSDFIKKESWRLKCFKNFEKYRNQLKKLAKFEYISGKVEKPDLCNQVSKLSKKLYCIDLMDNPFHSKCIDIYAPDFKEDTVKTWLNYDRRNMYV